MTEWKSGGPLSQKNYIGRCVAVYATELCGAIFFNNFECLNVHINRKVSLFVRKEELEDLVKQNIIALTYKTNMIEEGQLGKSKGILQVIWGKGWFNQNIYIYIYIYIYVKRKGVSDEWRGKTKTGIHLLYLAYLDVQMGRLQGREVDHGGALSGILDQITQQSSKNQVACVPQVSLWVGRWRGGVCLGDDEAVLPKCIPTEKLHKSTVRESS